MGEVISYTKEGIEEFILTAEVVGSDLVLTRGNGTTITLVGLAGGGEVTQAELDAAIAGLIDSAPETLNTMNEIAAAFNDDPAFLATLNAAIGDLDTRVDALEAAPPVDVSTKADKAWFLDDGSGAAAIIDGQAADIGGVWEALGSISGGAPTPLQYTGTGRISGPSGGGRRGSKLPSAINRSDDFYFHSKKWRSTANAMLDLFRHQDSNNYFFLRTVPGDLSIYQRVAGSDGFVFGGANAWADGDDIGVIVLKGTGNKRIMAIIVNGLIVFGPKEVDVQNSSTGFAIGVADDWGQAWDDVTIEAIPASLVYAANQILLTNPQTGTAYSLDLTDAGKVVELDNAAAITVTIPADSVVDFPIGTVIELSQEGEGQVEITPAVGVTLTSVEGKRKLFGQYAAGSLRKRAADSWRLVGDLVT